LRLVVVPDVDHVPGNRVGRSVTPLFGGGEKSTPA
jgi:hypothetical protein